MGKSFNIARALHLLPILILMAGCRTAEPSLNPPAAQNQRVIQWDRSPDNIIFQADVAGGPDTITRLSEIPLCTIYGDNRVVWTNELDAFNVQTLYDFVSDETIDSFITYLTVQERIYTFEAFAAEQTTPEVVPIVETVLINVNQRLHTADAFSGWDADWFARVLRSCQRLSQTPILFEPDGAWLTVATAPYNTEAPIIVWNPQDTGLSFADALASSQPRWITGSNVLPLWNALNTLPSALLFSENNQYYQVAVQVPGITRNAPPRPQD